MEKQHQPKQMIACIESLPKDVQLEILKHVGTNKNLNDIRNYCIVFDKRWGTNYHSDIDALISFLPQSIKKNVNDTMCHLLPLNSVLKWDWIKKNYKNAAVSTQSEIALQAITRKAPVAFLEHLITQEQICANLTDENETSLLSRAILYDNDAAALYLLENKSALLFFNKKDLFSRTPLDYAILKNNLPLVKKLVEKKAINKFESWCLALKNNSKEIVEYLYPKEIDYNHLHSLMEGLSHYTDPAVCKKIISTDARIFSVYRLENLLNSAIKNNNTNLITWLLTEKSAEIKITQDMLFNAVYNNLAEVAQILVKGGADPNYGIFFRLWNKGEDDPRAIKLLISLGLDVSKEDKQFGIKPLFVAANYPCPHIIQILLDHGATANEKNKRGETPISPALQCGDISIIKLLISHGAQIPHDALAICEQSEPVIDFLLEAKADPNARNPCGRSPLDVAAFRGSSHIIKKLIKAGADFQASKNSMLLGAVTTKNSKLLKMLLEKGADVTTQHCGKTLLHTLADLTDTQGENYLCCARLLLDAGITVNATDMKGQTPLHHIAAHRVDSRLRIPFMTLLIKKGANFNAQDDEGKTPLMHAITAENGEIVHTLLDAGANPWIKDNDGFSALSSAQEQAAQCRKYQDYTINWLPIIEKMITYSGNDKKLAFQK